MRGLTDRYQDIVGLTPWERVALAQRMAMSFASDAPMRVVAGTVCRTCRNIPREAPMRIARYVRNKIRYGQENPGVEVLQGPYHTLRYRVADCDDAALLWTVLCRALGMQAFFAGVGEIGSPYLIHAVGCIADTGELFELVRDKQYRGFEDGPVFRLPDYAYVVIYDPAEDGPEGSGTYHVLERGNWRIA